MKITREKVLFTIIIILFCSTMAYAAYIDQIIKATTNVVTSAGTYRVGGSVLLDEVTANTIARTALLGGSASVVWPLVGAAVATIGTYYIVSNMQNWVNWLKQQAGVWTPGVATGTVTYNLPQGHHLYIRKDHEEQIPYGGYQAYTHIYVTVGNTEANPSITAEGGYGQGPALYSGNAVVIRVQIDNNQGFLIYMANPGGWVNEVTYSWTPSVPVTSDYPSATVDNTALANAIKNNPGQIASGSSTQILPSKDPAFQVMPSVQGTAVDLGQTDPNTGASTDTETGEPTDPVTDPNADPNDNEDPLNPPGQPPIPPVDTTVDTPEQKDIGSLVGGFMANAPFMGILSAFEVQAISEQCTFTITLPFGNKTATINFCQFETLWAQIGAILIAFAYIYGVVIILVGR